MISEAAQMADVTLDKGSRVNMETCASCGGTHEAIEITPYSVAPFTHYFQCPTNNEPVPVCLKTFEGSLAEVNNSILRSVLKAQQAGAYLVAVYRVQNQRLHLDRHTINFPAADFEKVVEMLRDNLEQEAGPPPVKALPSIDPAMIPKVNLFED